MGAVKLELRCPQSVNGIAVDPEPDWSFDALLSELNSLESNLNSSSSSVPVPFTKLKSRELLAVKERTERSPGAFVMHLSDDDYESDDKEDDNQCLVTGSRFSCDDLYLSDSDDSDLEVQSSLMDKLGVIEGALFELSDLQRFEVEEEIRNQISALETDLMGQYEKSTYTTIQIEKYRDARREMDKKLDTQYQRKIAEALDNHLTAIQREHERRSQIEEKNIRSDAALENAKRKEKALQEEKRRQEKAIAEAEAMRKRGEEERIAALEAERKAAEEAAKREAADERAASKVREATGSQTGANSGNSSAQSKGPESIETIKSQTAGIIVMAAKNALNLEQGRLQKLKELDEKNLSVRSNSNQNYSSYERQIARWTKLITGTKESVRKKADELFKILNDPHCPQSISIAAFAQKVVYQCERINNSAFACAHAIVLLTSRVPYAMDIILAEFHKACIYTVPKHIHYSQSTFESREAYYKALGYRETDGKLETHDAYFSRLESYIEMYGALVQTQVEGVQNVHGLKEGWAWLARFLNCLPPNKFTAVALGAFLKIAGFALFRKYRSQFKKMLDFIAQDFLIKLTEKKNSVAKTPVAKNSVVTKVAMEIKTYIEDQRFLKEPEGWRLPNNVLSSGLAPDGDYRNPY